MEGRKQSGSSFATDLFGEKGSSAAASSSGIFDSIFAPPSRVSRGESLRLSETEKKHDSLGHSWNGKSAVSDENGKGGQKQSQSTTSNDKNTYNYEEQKSQPFHYSSSIYYGGQDVYSQPQSTQNPSATTFSKDVGDDDSGSASRGNWWQGSLYY